MTRIINFPATVSGEDLSETLYRDGCAVVTGVMDEALRDALRAELAPYFATADPEAGGGVNESMKELQYKAFYAGKTKRVAGLVRRCPTYRRLVTHPLVLAACDAILKPNCANYQVHGTGALIVGPGASEQVLHRDEDLQRFFFKPPRPNMILSSMWALTDFTEANGATRIVPESHLWSDDRIANEAEVAHAEMAAGSVLFWMGGTLHGAGANRTGDWRHGLFLAYSLGWLRQVENQYLQVPAALAMTLPEQLRDLIGYKLHAGLGYFDLND